MTRQTSFQLDETTEALIAFLNDRGYGTTTNILRTAVKRMAEEEGYRTMRFFKYTGPDMLTRGDYGVSIRGGHSAADDPGALAVFDPDFGDFVWSSIDAALESGEWIEISGEEHAKL